jgi:PKD repeat protein
LQKTVTYTANITTPASQCPTFTLLNTAITYHGATCTDPGTCQPNDQVTFSLTYFPAAPDQSCLGTITYAWQVDSTPAGTGATITTGLSSGAHVIACTLKAGNQTLNMTRAINVGTVTPPPPPPPPPTGCGTITNQNVYINFSGTTSTCQLGGTCTSGETISFQAQTWNFTTSNCSLSYSWSYDGGAGVAGGAQVTHAFSTAGNHTVTCTVSTGSSSAIANASIVIGGSTPSSCPTLTSGQNVFFDYAGATSGCSSANSTQCSANEQIGFTVTYWPSSCGTPTYTWKVDGAAVAGSGPTNTVTLTAGSHTVSVIIDNGNPTPSTLSQTLNISNGVKPNYTFDFSIKELAFPPYSYAFTVNTTPDSAAKPGQQWQWNFGDGSPVVTHGSPMTYTFPDDKQYTITVTDPNGAGVVSHTLPANPGKRRAVSH